MHGYFFISYCFPVFGLLTGVSVLTRPNPQQLAQSTARQFTVLNLDGTQSRPNEGRRDRFERKPS
jgi:hypothetical protein